MTNTLNTDNTNDIFFQSNNVNYAQFDYSEDILRLIKDVRFTLLNGILFQIMMLILIKNVELIQMSLQVVPGQAGGGSFPQ